jgi:hydroxymethylpyrimidine pyrophosphatase-like HAD family hydrolase
VTPTLLVATDLDGTLVHTDRTVSPRSAAALDRVVAAGGAVVFVTGRPIRWLPEVYRDLRVRPLAVCANGAAVYDPASDTIVHAAPIAPADLARAVARLREAVPGVRFGVELDGGRLHLHESGYDAGPWEDGRSDVRVASPAELVARPASKLLVKAGPQPPDAFTRLVDDCLDGLGEATHSSNSGMVEVSAAGVTKAAGLAWVADRLGVPPERVVAFGDMPNDLPMLTWAGHAVAMANAHPDVLEAADAVTGGHDADGVADYLERLLDRTDQRYWPAPVESGGC